MTHNEFIASLTLSDAATGTARTKETCEAAAIHAYLHRRENDTVNAQYWHRQANRAANLQPALEEEWENLVWEMTML